MEGGGINYAGGFPFPIYSVFVLFTIKFFINKLHLLYLHKGCRLKNSLYIQQYKINMISYLYTTNQIMIPRSQVEISKENLKIAD